MTPKQIEQAANKLVEATTQSASEAGTTAEARAAALAPELAGGSSLPGGYMYQRHIAPVVPALTADLVSQGRQQATRGAIRDALHTSSVTLEKAQRAQRQRQRDFEAERHRRYEENARRQRARAQAQQNAIAALQSGGGGNIYSGGVQENPTTTQQWIGQNNELGRTKWLAAYGTPAQKRAAAAALGQAGVTPYRAPAQTQRSTAPARPVATVRNVGQQQVLQQRYW